MIDPEWLIEENKLEARSASIQTFSNSSMCLDEIKKLIETGAKREDLLDTLVTNVNTEANQLINDPDIVHSKKYQSEVLLPTFISDNEMEHEYIRSCSRRSLRPDKIKSPDSISHEEFLSPPSFIKTENTTTTTSNTTTTKATNNNDNSNSNFSSNNINNSSSHDNLIVSKKEPRKCNLASIETLNSSEKMSSTDRESNFSSLNLSLDENLTHFPDASDDLIACHRGGMHGSRYSLNETVFVKPQSYIDRLKHDIKNTIRGNSLNVVYENEIFQPNNQSSPTQMKIMPNGNTSEIILPMQNSMSKYKHQRRKHSTTLPAITGNLKRNPSLRYSNYLKNMRVHRNSIHYRGAMLTTHRYRLKASSCPNIYRNSMTTIAKEDEVNIITIVIYGKIIFYALSCRIYGTTTLWILLNQFSIFRSSYNTNSA
jgi:hypothetical protein